MSRSIELKEQRGEAWLHLVLLEAEPHFPSFHLSVEVRDGGFHGECTACVSLDEWRAFITAAQSCERTRSGSAQLQSLSPGELTLALMQRDGAGHFAVRYEIGETRMRDWGRVDHRLSGAFELDSERFGEIVRSMIDLIPQ